MFRTIALTTGLIVTTILPLLMIAQPSAFWRALFVIAVIDGLVLVTTWLNARDMQMPTLSGVDLSRALREARPDLPIAIASGYTADDKRAISVRWIQKPVPLTDLSRVLRDLLGAPAPDTSQPYPDPRRGR